MEHYISYYRVSTDKQGKSGLGLKAQRQQVKNFLKGKDATLLDTFTEVESGSNGNRPVLRDAVQRCKDEGAKLLVAKLDRLSRNVKFLFTLKEELESAGVGFVFADMPKIGDNILVLGMLALVAQYELDLISKRTQEALEARRKETGEWRVGQDWTDTDRQKAAEAKSRKAFECSAWQQAYWFIKAKREDGGMTYAEIASALNAKGYRTRRDKKFYPATVREVYLRYKDKV